MLQDGLDQPRGTRLKDIIYIQGMQISKSFSDDGNTLTSEKVASHVHGGARLAIVENGRIAKHPVKHLFKYLFEGSFELDNQGSLKIGRAHV